MARKRSPGSTGFSIPARVLARIEPLERTPSGRPRTYVDPVSGEVFTQYALQRAKNFGLTPAQAAAAKKIKVGKQTAFDVARKAHKRHEHLPILFERAAQFSDKSKDALMKDKKFWQRIKQLSNKRSTQSHGRALHYFGYIPSPTLYSDDSGDMDDFESMIDEDFREDF